MIHSSTPVDHRLINFYRIRQQNRKDNKGSYHTNKDSLRQEFVESWTPGRRQMRARGMRYTDELANIDEYEPEEAERETFAGGLLFQSQSLGRQRNIPNQSISPKVTQRKR